MLHIGKVTVTVGVASRVTDRGMANTARAVNQNDLDSFHAEYGIKLSPQLDDARRYEILEMLHRYKSTCTRYDGNPTL